MSETAGLCFLMCVCVSVWVGHVDFSFLDAATYMYVGKYSNVNEGASIPSHAVSVHRIPIQLNALI